MIDSHVHVWDPARVDYPWLVEAPALDRRFDVSDIDNELDAAGVVAVILVQAADHIDDTELMLDLAAFNPRVAGVVGWVPLLDPPAAARALDRWATPRSSACAISFTAIPIPTCSSTHESTMCWR